MMKQKRDRRERGARGPLFASTIPRYKNRTEIFDSLVIDAYEPLLENYGEVLSNIDIAIDLIPRMQIGNYIPNNVVCDGIIPLGRFIPAGIDHKGNPTRGRIVLFRRPIEQRTRDKNQRYTRNFIHSILVDLVAYALNKKPSAIKKM